MLTLPVPNTGRCGVVRCSLGVLAIVVLASGLSAAEPTPQQLEFFETRVRPLLVEKCQSCHGSKKEWAGLRLDSRAAILKGGETGPAVVPGQPQASLLIAAVRQTGDLVMPPDGTLTEQQIADLAEWISMGVPFPEDAAVADKSGHRDPNHWSFQPRQQPALPDVQNNAWVQTGIDRWILARLEAEGLSPASPADKRALIRRVTFDLTGLPPTPEEIAAFLADERADAYAQVVDRLLASSAYGERWGRHWLDVARYADSNGLDENVAHGNAWKYRDYVVSAFNDDLPYDRFLIEQIAGDLLPYDTTEQRYRQLIATGFLALGAKVIAEVDEVKMQMDIIDEQIDTLGKAVLGMTFGCARCHDHKFDPVTTANYYGLAGIFKSTRTMESYVKVARWYENPLPTPESDAATAAHAAEVAAKQAVIDQFIAAADKAVEESLAAGATIPEKKEPHYPAATKTELAKLRAELKQLQQAAPEIPSAMGVTEGRPCEVAIHIRGSHLKLGEVTPRHVPAVMKGPAIPEMSKTHSGRLELAQWLVDPQHPLTARVIVNRVWRGHFGRGLVASTDNFGILGDRPTHPELLDWLANEFVNQGWSLKWLHRQMVLSSTYCQGTQPSTESLEKDIENRLWSRYPVRRLEAEAVRDALLAVSGQLDHQAGGPVLTVKNRGYLFDHTSKDLTQYTSRRRSIYLPVIRNNVYDLFQLLDYPDPANPNGDRNTTTVAPQALLMLNSDLVFDCADSLAARVWSEQPDDETARLQRLTQLVLGRDATDTELAAHRQMLRELAALLTPAEGPQQEAVQKSWSVLCQALLASNEFLYLN